MKGWKTVLLGLTIALTSIFSSPEMQVFFAENLPVVGSVTGTLVVVLRALTSSPIFKKE